MKKLNIALGLFMAAATVMPSWGATETMPYEITFDSSNYNTWQSIDDGQAEANWKNLIWMWNNNSWWYSLTSAQKTPADDWVVSPLFDIVEGTQYEISYRIDRYSGDSSTVTLEMVEGADAVTSKQMIDTWEVNADKGKVKTVTFTANSGGELRFGLHMTMQYTSAQKIQFKSFAIKALSKASAPGAVSDFTVTPGADGAATATLQFKAPQVDAEGNELTGTVDVKIYREDDIEPCHTESGLAPGAAGSWTDTEAYTGETWYIVRAVGDGGEGVETRADAWIGEDEPLAVLFMGIDTAGKPTVTWTPAEGGVHGGYVHYGSLKYVVSRVEDGKLAKLGEVSETTFTDNDLDDSTQKNVSYQIVAKSSAGLGEAAQSDAVNVGPQLSLPFAESFANTAYTTSPWMQQTVKNAEGASREPSWELVASKSMEVDATDDNPEGVTVTISSQDTDRGMIVFNAMGAGQWTNYCESRLVMPAIDFTEMLNPVLTFYIFRESWSSLDPATQNGRNDDYITVAARSENGEFVAAEGEFHRYGKQNAWELCEVPLYKFAGKGRVQVALVGHGVGNHTYIDNIRIEERTAYDLAMTEFTAPERVRVGEASGMSAVVKNNGGFAADDYTVNLYKDGVEVESANAPKLEPGKSAVVRFAYAPADDSEGEAEFSAKINYAADQDLTNNNSASATVAVTAALLPAVNTLDGSFVDGKSHLTWKAASWLPAETLVESDGFETYEPFAINSFGDFSSYDLDNKITVPITGLTYPNAGERMACQIMTPAMTDIDPEELDLWAPHSGINMVILPQATSQTSDIASNDWLVFPMLSGNAQTIKMWLRSVNDEKYPEYVLGYYSTVANPIDADDFLSCPDSEASYAVPSTWTHKDYSVPAGAKWFALRHISQTGYMLMLDDVTYQRSVPSMTPDGYNVYCNGEKVNDELLSECVFDHQPTVENSKYTVKAVYGDRESTASNDVLINLTGVQLVEMEAEDGVYYNLQGIRVENPANGVYMLRKGGKTTKVMVK